MGFLGDAINNSRTTPTTTKDDATRRGEQFGDFLETAEQVGVETDRFKKPQLSALQRFGRALTSFETGNAVYQSYYGDKPFLKTYLDDISLGIKSAWNGLDYRTTPKKTYKDILVKEGFKDRPGKVDTVDVLGFVADVVADPTTFFGGAIGKTALKGTKGGIKALKKAPIIGTKVESVLDTAGNMFVPFHSIKKLGVSGEAYVDQYLKFVKGTRANVDEFINSVISKTKEVKKQTGLSGSEAGAKIGVAVETGKSTGIGFLDEIMDSLKKTQDSFTKQEVERGILDHQLPDYMHHMLSPEAADFMASGGNLTQFFRPIQVRLGAAKGRRITGKIVRDINEEYRSKLGFDLFEEDAFKAFGKRGVDSIKAVQTHDFLQRVGSLFGKKVDEGFVDQTGTKWIGVKAKELNGIKLPEPIAKQIDEFTSVITNDTSLKKFLNLYDKGQNLFKASVTGLFPAFHTRNLMGGIFNNYIAGVKNPAIYGQILDILRPGVEGTIKAGKKVYTYDDVRKLMKDHGVIGQTGILDVPQFLQKEINPSVGSKIKKAPAKVMGSVENFLRGSLFTDALKKGMSPEDAARKVIKYHFDYMPEGFTKFEGELMKRVIPFYTWTRNNIPLQLEQIIAQPGKYSGIFKLQRSIGVSPGSEEEKYLPSWMKDRILVKTEGGYWSGIGTPLEEAMEKIGDPKRGLAISLSPFVKAPIERMTGYNLFKEKRISEDVYGTRYKNMPEFLQNWLEFRKEETDDGRIFYKVNAEKRYWLELIAARGLSTTLALSQHVEDKSALTSLFTTIKKFNYSIDELKSWSDSEVREQLEEELEKRGILHNLQIPTIFDSTRRSLKTQEEKPVEEDVNPLRQLRE